MRKILCALTCLTLLVSITGCGKPSEETAQEQETEPAAAAASPAETEAPTEAAETSAAAKAAAVQKAEDDTALLHITIESPEISVSALKEQDYTVPVLVSIDKNPGITYSEWGLTMDSRCTFTATEEDMSFNTVYSINDEKHFLWTAWSSGAQVIERTGGLLQLSVKLPMDAAAGNTYEIHYADMSMADKPHKWSDGQNDWAADNVVGWTDGVITVTE